jgi:L-ascorbate oxidase
LGPLQSQVYRFEANPSGTFFYHAHKSMLDSDGASGMLIVTPKQSNSKTPAYDEERHVFLKDWWHATSDQQVVGLMASPFVFVGSPDAILVNGKAIWFQCAQGGQYFNNSNYCLSTCTNMSSSLETINVSAGKTYRLRIVNAASLVIMNVAFKDHNLTIIEQDGTMIDPVEVTSLDLSPGQRFSVLLEANQDPATYWMKVSVRFRNYPNITGLAILQYEEANTTIPSLTTESPLNVMWNDTMFGMAQEGMVKTQDPSSFSESSALRADSSTIRRLILVSTQAKDPSTGGLVWAINNVSSNGMTTSPEPLLMRAYEAASIEYPGSVEGTVDLLENPPVVFNYSNPLVEGPGPMVGSKATQILRLLKGDVVEIIFQNTRALNNVSELHSWHVHGHSAWLLAWEVELLMRPRTLQITTL